MFRLLLFAAVCLVAPVFAVAKDHREFDPLAAYGPQIEFEVMRNGDPIGNHTVSFRRSAEGLHVDVEMSLKVRLLGITVYRFAYLSESVWRNGQLAELKAITDDDGEISEVDAVMQDGGLWISGPAGLLKGPAGLFPTDHWHPGVRGSETVINTITGQLAAVAIRQDGAERIATGTGSRAAARHVYSGDLHDIEVWYDNEGRWVRLRFPDKSGGMIDYRCIRCGPERTGVR